MSTPQPASTDPLNSPDHSLLHRQITADTGAPVESVVVDSSGALSGGTPLFQNINPTNLLSNGDFENWSAGTSVAPDGWTQGAMNTIAQEATIIKLGTYSTKITKTVADAYIYQNIHTTRGIAYWQGRTITLGCWVYATVANRAVLILSDGIVDTYSSYHTGNSTWQLLTVTKTVSVNATSVQVYLYVGTGATSAYFDGAMVVEGSSAFAFSDKPASYLEGDCTAGMIAGTSGTITLNSSYNTLHWVKIGKMEKKTLFV